MDEVSEIIKITFDNWENNVSTAIIKKSLGMFKASDKLSAHGKVAKFLETLPAEEHYLGHDGEIYPKFILKNHIVK